MLNRTQRKVERKKPTLLFLIGASVTYCWNLFWEWEPLYNLKVRLYALYLVIFLFVVFLVIASIVIATPI